VAILFAVIVLAEEIAEVDVTIPDNAPPDNGRKFPTEVTIPVNLDPSP
jgi:hypothetical protein